jgi:hypothetical protein
MTHQDEIEVAERSISLLESIEKMMRAEIKTKYKCLNIDFHKISLIQGAIISQKRRLSYHRFQILLGR